MILQKLKDKNLINPPSFLVDNTMYLTYMGSRAYACDTENSDNDAYGFCIPPKDIIFPHLSGKIEGFGQEKERFRVWQQHHIIDNTNGKEWDFQIYNIVDFFHLCMNNNPNMIDSLFTPTNAVLVNTQIGQLVRSNRTKFLSKKSFHTMKGYAYAQLAKMNNKNRIGKRKELVEKWSFDIKYAYHIVRLLLECEMILTEKDLDLQRHNRQLIAIRNGEWTAEQVKEFFTTKEKQLEELYIKSDLRPNCNEQDIKELLLNCLEIHYGSLSATVIVKDDIYVNALKNIKNQLELVGI